MSKIFKLCMVVAMACLLTLPGCGGGPTEPVQSKVPESRPGEGQPQTGGSKGKVNSTTAPSADAAQ